MERGYEEGHGTVGYQNGPCGVWSRAQVTTQEVLDNFLSVKLIKSALITDVIN